MILQWWIHVIRHLPKLIDCTTPRMNPNVHYGPWVIMIYQCWFISYNKCTILVWGIDTGGGWEGKARSIWELSIPSTQFCCKSKTALKSKIYLKGKKWDFLVVQWIRLHTPNAGDPGSIPGRGTRSHMPAATKSSHASTKDPACCN